MTILKKLNQIQIELNAPKSRYNSFGKYKYRSCEDILEGIKPLLNELGCALIISDEIVNIGERFYVKATARLLDGDSSIDATAFAREAVAKKGMDEAQITGSASSYARKYALNGLLCIDDTQDADTKDNSSKGFTEADKKKIDEIKSVDSLKKYWEANQGKGKEFTSYITERKNQLTQSE